MRMHAIGLAVALTVACTGAMGYQAETPAVKTVTPASPQVPVSSRERHQSYRVVLEMRPRTRRSRCARTIYRGAGEER